MSRPAAGRGGDDRRSRTAARRRAVVLACALTSGATMTLAQSTDGAVRRAEMRGHFSELLTIHDAVAQGDLGAARAPAMELAYVSVPVGSPATAAAFGAAIRDAARRASRETTVAGAARAVTGIVQACADCHRASGAAIAAEGIIARPPDGPGGMIEHVRAADDMLLGLLLPSETRWAAGAERLQTVVFRGSDSGRGEALRHVAARAGRATTASARASNYVHLLATCAECHATVSR